jgi:hypothetical protein
MSVAGRAVSESSDSKRAAGLTRRFSRADAAPPRLAEHRGDPAGRGGFRRTGCGNFGRTARGHPCRTSAYHGSRRSKDTGQDRAVAGALCAVAWCLTPNPAGLGAGPPCAFGGRSHPAHGCREEPASVARSSMTGLSSVELRAGRGTKEHTAPESTRNSTGSRRSGAAAVAISAVRTVRPTR